MGKSVCEEAFKLSKEEVFDKSMTYWNSGKTKEWLDLKIDLLIGKREGYYFWDMDGKKLMDVHINGGTYSLGHRNPEVIEALKNEFSKNNINVDIDAQTGALTLEASVMFDYDQAELTDAGKQALEQILPIYCKVLLQDDYMKYLAEIIIDGYTDTDGDYSYNLQLSQQRSLAVAQYLLDIQGNFLDSTQSANLQNYLTVNGHSMANPVLDADGNVDKDASRRVEIKFRLKDEEMIDELNQIMSSSSDTASADTASSSDNTSAN